MRNSFPALSIYAKFPSVGFKYSMLNEYQIMVTKRFQICFNFANEFQQFISFLHENNFNIKDDSVNNYSSYIPTSSQFTRPTHPQNLNNSFSQPLKSQDPINCINEQQQSQLSVLPMSQVDRHKIEQPQVDDFLSQILKPKPRELKDLSDEKLQEMLNEKLRDTTFINFVSTLKRVISF